MKKNAALLFVVLVIAGAIGYMLWARAQAGNVGGLTFAQAGSQKQAAVDAADAATTTATA